MHLIARNRYQPEELKTYRRLPAAIIAALVNLLIVSLPLLFWPTNLSINVAALLLVSCLLCGFEWFSGTGKPEVLKEFRRYPKLATIGGVLLLLLQWSCLAEAVICEHNNAVAATAGFLTAITGCAIRIAAIKNLQTAFRSELSDSKLITTGIHSVIRHPSETGLLIASFGISITAGAFYSAIVILPACWLVAQLRINEEERWMHAQHGKSHADYCSNTGQWLPTGKRYSDASLSPGEPSI